MSKFKVGDKVVCIESNSLVGLELGAEYIIADVIPDLGRARTFVVIDAFPGFEFFPERFVLATRDAVNHPPHYTSHPSGVECIQVTEHMGFCIGNAMKYLWRADEKHADGGLEDLKKAAWYVQREIERRENEKV